MFSALADDDDEPQQQQKVVQKKAAPAQPKKQDERPKTAAPPKFQDLGDFEGVTGQETKTRGGFRGGRGGQRGGRGGARGGRGERREGEEGRSPPRGGFRGGRGGRGGRGERREGEEGGFEPRGDNTDRPRGRGRATRGRGGRPQGEEGAAVEGGDEGVLYVQRKERVDHVGKDQHFQGKKTEQWHPYDRRSGTGRGRDVAKGGHGKGNVGKVEDEIKYGEEVTPATEENKVEKTAVEGVDQEEVPQLEGSPDVKRQREEPVEEEEEKGLTLQEFLAQKKTVGIKKEARLAEQVVKANIEKVVKDSEKTQQINSQLKDRDLYATGRQEGADLLGFQGGDDEYYPREERSGRGGRRGGRGGNRGGAARGGNQGG